jgi:hypothetical protein
VSSRLSKSIRSPRVHVQLRNREDTPATALIVDLRCRYGEPELVQATWFIKGWAEAKMASQTGKECVLGGEERWRDTTWAAMSGLFYQRGKNQKG